MDLLDQQGLKQRLGNPPMPRISAFLSLSFPGLEAAGLKKRSQEVFSGLLAALFEPVGFQLQEKKAKKELLADPSCLLDDNSRKLFSFQRMDCNQFNQR